MRKRSFSFPWKKYISTLLIGILVFTQTVRVDFFDSVGASTEQSYRDIVSIFVDKTTYDQLDSEINRYANDIQDYLGNTRVSLIIVNPGVEPAHIAAKNEKLYQEGEEGDTITSHLVGTILIGNIPVPMVGDNGSYFPSMYPYVDFVDKAFVYNARSNTYEASPGVNSKAVEADIWHGVINPAVGRTWDSTNDPDKISQFLDKTHNFYTKSGKFTTSSTPPRVFYYDGEYEAQSVNLRSLYQYDLSMQNSENLAYKRFTKYLLSDINKALDDYDKLKNNNELNEFVISSNNTPHSSTFDTGTIAQMPDIQTKLPIQSLLKDFQSIINKKTLSDAFANVHNAGRYNSGSEVRVDVAPIKMTVMDEIARTTLKEANDAIIEEIDASVAPVARKIPIFVSQTVSVPDPIATNTGNRLVTQVVNYMFGKNASEINDVESCSIARGSTGGLSYPFGRNVLVEANVAFDISSTQGHVDILTADTSEFVLLDGSTCFNGSNVPKIKSYWGGNSMLRIIGSTDVAKVLQSQLTGVTYTGFTLPIFSLGGMKETNNLHALTIDDCRSTTYQYTLLQPYTYFYNEHRGDNDYQCEAGYPSEWNHSSWNCDPALFSGKTPRFTCFTSPSIGVPLDFYSVATTYQNKANNPLGCFAGDLVLNGTTILSVRNNTCFDSIGDGSSDTVDRTRYETTKFNSISSVLSHISPTDKEILAAETNATTPSLPVDMVRYVEFLTPGQYKAKINYPNFFNIPDDTVTDIDTFRSWFKSLGETEWNKVINGNGGVNNIASDYFKSSDNIPSTPPDWNDYISDESINMILRARNWLNPEVTSKYKQAVETSLSYSQEYSSKLSHLQPPKYPVNSNGYEIAYLGLAPFIPGNSDDTDTSDIEQAYTYKLTEIEGINISEPHEQGDKNPYAKSDACGPPEGVDIFKWPAAIMCWMKTLLPPRIIAGSCGSNSIGSDNSSSSKIVSPPAGFSSESQAMSSFYNGGRLVYSTERTSMNYDDSLAIDFEYTKDGNRLLLPTDSFLMMQIVSARDDNGDTIPQSKYSEYFFLAPQKVMTSDAGGTFLVNSKNKKATIQLQTELTIVLPEGEEYILPSSDLITININSEYLRILPERDGASGYSFDVTVDADITLKSEIVDNLGSISDQDPSITDITVIDDTTGIIVYTGSFSSTSALPSDISGTVGVYRIILRDNDGRIGETILAITSGKLEKIVITPAASKIKKGSNTLVVLHLQDSKGNPITPDLNKITVDVTGGYIADINGKREDSIIIDSMESDIPLLVGSDVSGIIALSVSADTLTSPTGGTIRVLDDIKVQMTPEPGSNLQVGGLPVKMKLEIQDTSNNPISDFISVAAIDIPLGVGTSDRAVIDIKNGSGSFIFTPGTRSGTHPVRLDIPGIGAIDKNITLLPGVPMYISHVEGKNGVDFILNDRYGNLSPEDLSGTGTFNSAGTFSFSFSDGKFTSTPKKTGYYSLTVPSLSNSSISYTDDSGVHTASGIPFYATYIKGNIEKFDFLSDYNARYSVLYGDSYLGEGEDILYNSSPTTSSSLAVTTLLDSPYITNVLATVLPGGKILLSDTQEDAIAEASVSLKDGFAKVHIHEVVSQKSIGDVLYTFNNAKLNICEDNCNAIESKGPEIYLVPNTELGLTGSKTTNQLELKNEGVTLFTIGNDGKMTLSEGLTLQFIPDTAINGLVLDVQAGGSSIAELILITDTGKSVAIISTDNTPFIGEGTSVIIDKFSRSSLNSPISGYSFRLSTGQSRSLDEKKIGPRGIDSYALTHDTPGIGWGGNNKTLLSYAAGDTVGEASRWFHTYTMINMGDPVAHVDHDAVGTRIEGIDRTIGTQITSNLRAEVASYSHKDMDNDGLEDIITLDTDGYVSLYSNLRTRFRHRQDIAYVPDLTERGVSFGDFTGDGFADILGLDHSGSLVFIDNVNGKLTRSTIELDDGSLVPTGITNFKIFNMDNDGGDDIVYMSEGGELAILYYDPIARKFTRNILDDTLGVTLSDTSSAKGGALYFDALPQIAPEKFGVSSTSNTDELDDALLDSEVYYQYSQSINTYSDDTSDNTTSDISQYESELENELGTNGSTLGSTDGSLRGAKTSTYIKSQYAEAYDLKVTRSWEKVDSGKFLHAGDRIRATIEIENTSATPKTNIMYLDSISKNLDSSETESYNVKIKGSGPGDDIPLTYIGNGDYDIELEGIDIPAGGILVFEYILRSLPTRPGELIVGLMEGGESGDDLYGDVGIKGTTSCGDDMLLWSSIGPRSYNDRSIKQFVQPKLPDDLLEKVIDADGNEIPDSIENMSPGELQKQNTNLSKTTTTSSTPLVNTSTVGGRISIGFDSKAAENINTMVKDMQDGLACGFGGGSCMSFPINWAPLAPGTAPSVFGYPLWELQPELGKPLFSGLTWYQAYCGTSPCCLPSVYPATSLGYGNGMCDPRTSFGGKGGVWDSTNFFRVFVTPTLTLGMGGAICFGGPAEKAGKVPPSKLFGFIQGGNCIVTAKPMPFCKGDGTDADGDVKGVSGLGNVTDAWNASSCTIDPQSYGEEDDKELTENIVKYKKTGAPPRKDLYKSLTKRPAKSITTGPLLRIGGGSGGGTDVSIELDTSKPFTLGNIIKVKNGRVPAFPDFIMSWVSDQLNELINALFTAPNLIIVLPGAVGANMQFDGNWNNFQKKFTDAYSSQSLDNIKTQMGQAYNANNVAASLKVGGGAKTGLSQSFSKWQSNLLSGGAGKAIGQAQGGLASVRSAYKLIGQLPFITLRKQTVPINVPWILPRELDKYAKSLENYKKEYEDTLKNWCAPPNDTQDCLTKKASISNGGFMSSISQNLSRIEEYKKFPAKLQKYVTWKQQYMSQILCNVDTIRQMLGGWIKENGVRFRKWAELYVLIKAIADSWQPLIDVFRDTSRKCDVCHNQRNSTVDWKLKLLSALIPSPPIMKFPRWPDIILDLSDIKLGINISVPDFKFNIKPIRLPSLPTLSLPDSPTVSLTLPKIPVLPAIPKLPDLPELPSLPKLALPNLPTPPKIPKLFGSIEIAIKAFKIYGTIKCFLNSTFLAPEAEVGDIISHKTERQGTLDFDFLGIKFPNFTLPSVQELRVSTHVNFNIRSDFITEFAKQAVKPVNEFTTDIGRSMPSKVINNVKINSPIPDVNVIPGVYMSSTGEYLTSLKDMQDIFDAESKVLLDTSVFKDHILSQLSLAGRESERRSLQLQLQKSEIEGEKLTEKLLELHNKKFDVLTRYIQAEYDSTAELQNIIDMITDDGLGDLSLGDIYGPSQLVSSDTSKKTDKLLKEYDDLNIIIDTDRGSDYSTSSTFDSLTRLQDKVHLLADAGYYGAQQGMGNPGTSSAGVTTPMDGYAPVFEGVFILTESGKQIRLFDITEGLSASERIEIVDIDDDGDKDYMFRLDGVLYIKYSGNTNRSDSIDNSIESSNLTPTSPVPSTPNYFHETNSTPKNLNFSFRPSSDTEREWRMNFYDSYMEWDRLELNDPDIAPEHVIDLYVEDDPITPDTTKGFTVSPIHRSIKSIGDSSTFRIRSPEITVLTIGTNFTLSAGRPIYTGKEDVTISYSTGSQRKTLELTAYNKYVFNESISAEILSETLYTFEDTKSQKEYGYSDDYIGMPIVSGMEILVENGGFSIKEHTINYITDFLKGTHYMLKSLGSPSDEYTTTIPYANGMYSTRIEGFDTDSGKRVYSDITLLSPQSSSDTNSPIIDTPDIIRIPVYATGSLDLTSYISEMNEYDVVFDEDITKDSTGGNGLPDDDFTQTGSNMKLKGKKILFEKQEELSTYTALLKITDEMGNISFKDLKVEIYAPIPQVESITNKGFTGSIDEKTFGEPIDLFRVRPGQTIEQITTASTRLKSDNDGQFKQGATIDNEGSANLMIGTTAIAQISPKGVITNLSSGYSIKVTPASSISPLKLDIVDSTNSKVVYTQFMLLPESTSILSSGEYTSGDALVVTPSSGYISVKAAVNDPSIPGGMYIIKEATREMIAAIAEDGNVYGPSIILDYNSSDDYILLTLTSGGTEIATLHYKTSFFYTVK